MVLVLQYGPTDIPGRYHENELFLRTSGELEAGYTAYAACSRLHSLYVDVDVRLGVIRSPLSFGISMFFLMKTFAYVFSLIDLLFGDICGRPLAL